MADYTFVEDMVKGIVNSYKEIPRENKKKNFSPNRENDVIHFESRQWKYSKCKGAG